MMGGTDYILEGLFRVKEKEEQKAKAQRCKVVCALGTQEREAFLAEVITRLHHLLNQEPSNALLVSLRCEGCPTLKKVLLGSCWGELLQMCCQHLGTLKEEEGEKEEEPWPPPLFPCAVRVLYATLKEYSSQEHHQSPLPPPVPPLPLPIPQHRALMAAHVALTKALLTPLALGSHSLVASSALWLVLQLLEPQRATTAFLDTLWTVNYLGRRRKANSQEEKVAKEQEEEENTATDCEEECIKDNTRKSTRESSRRHLQDSNLAGKRKEKANTQEEKVEEQREEESRITNHEEENVKENAGMNSVHLEKKGEVNTPERKVKEQEEDVNTNTNHKEDTMKKNTRRNTTGTNSIHLKEVQTAIETAKKGEEGKKLMREKFEELDKSCYSSSALLLQGMLNAGGKWLLKEGYGGRVFLYSLHPLLLKLCSGGAAQHTFQAFQTLHLWLRAVRDLGTLERIIRSSRVPEDSGKGSAGVPYGHTPSPLLPHPSQEPLFNMAPGSQGPVFTLLNASWESPAKGVGEMVGRCMEELFSLHEDGEKGTRKKLAKDMLEALLSSSATSSCFSSSIWASKSSYPPLALALVHLGCEKALQLHPSLPSSLTYSLGVNHLAPPGTTVYKVFLAQLGETSWRNHFLAPVCKALCSQDRLTQQHVLSLWLPPTLRHYPDIHWALLASCGSDTPSWLAHMALLRVARSVGSLHLGREVKEVGMKVTNRHKDKILRSARDKSEKSARDEVTSRRKDETLRSAEDKSERSARDKSFTFGPAEDSKSNKASADFTKSNIGNENGRDTNSINEGRSGSAREEREEEGGGEKEEEEDQEALILQYITTALRHRDENVRLEALYLLCQTHKTSQPVTLFEAQCLMSFLTHNMNIDSAPFRQGVLKCVAALMVRLRGATASQSKSHATKESAKESKGIRKGQQESAGTLRSALVPGEKRKGNSCDENSTLSQEINQDKSENPGGSKDNLLKCFSVHKVKESHQESVNLRNQEELYGKNIGETTGEPFSAPNRNQGEEEEEEGKDQGVLATSASIVLWLVREAHRGMAPDSNYQRRILSLQLYKEVLVALLLPSVANHRPGKRSNTNPEPLLTYLNNMAQKEKCVWGDKDAVRQPHVKLSHKAGKGTKNIPETPLDCHGDYEREKVASHHSPNQMKTINSDEKAREKHLANQSQDIHTGKKALGQQNVLGLKQAFQEPRGKRQLSSDEKASNKHLANQTEYVHHGMKPSEWQDFHEHQRTITEPLDTHRDERALNQPLIDLKYPWTLTVLLHLAQDEMNDVRTESCEIIHLFASEGKMCLSPSEGKEWMRRAMKLCDSPKASDAESGGTLALTVALLLPGQCQREVLEDVFGAEVKGGGSCTCPPSLAESLLARVESQFGAARSNLLKAARHTPIHGTLQALGCCIAQVEKRTGREESASTLPPDLPHSLASLLRQLVEFVLNTLASTSPLGAAVPPSFAEMGEAVGRVVEKGKEEEKEEEMEKDTSPSSVSSLLEEEEEEEEGLLSSDHVLVLSCCWQILKSCCEVTGQAIHLFTHDPQGADDLIRAVVVRVLLGTRHKGAMEAARATYASLWASLLQSATSRGLCGTLDTQFIDILHRQVGEVVSSLGSPSNTSVTRRAAGVAMMVQAACGAAPRTTTSLLTATLTTLTTIASTEVALDETGTTDAPPALALHILQSLALHSPLGPFLQPHLTPLTSCCLHAFSSPSWAIRNAALQLFGSLVSCLVGQKKVRDDASALNSLTVPEFLSRHPSLAQHLLYALEGESGCYEGKDGVSYSADDSLTQDTLMGFQDMHTGVYTLQGTEIHTLGNTETHMEVHNTTSSSKETHTPSQWASTLTPKYTERQIKPHSPTHQPKPTQQQAGTHAPTHPATQTHTSKPSPTQAGTHTSTHSETYTPKPLEIQTGTHTSTQSETQTQPHTPSCPQNPTQRQAGTLITRASILVPVLSLVARLSPGTGLQQNPKLAKTLHRLWCSTACLLYSPVHSVRRLVALALVSLTPSNVAFKQACSILRKASDPLTPTNLLNGLLMALCSFLQTHPKLAKDTRLRDYGTKSLSWLLGPDNKCHVNTALALKIMMVLGIKNVDTQHMPTLDPSLPGAADCHLTYSLMELSLWPRCTIEKLFLSDPPADSDVLDGCSGAILAEIKECQHSSWLLRYERLFWYWLDDHKPTPKAVAALLSLLSAVMEREESAGMNLPTHRLTLVLSCMEGQHGSQATCAALVLTAHLLRKPHTSHGTLKAFITSITQHSQPTASEDHRLAASAALKVAIKPLLSQCHCIDLVLREQLIVATVALLQDENSAIRDSAADIVVALLTPSTNTSQMAPLTPSLLSASKVSHKPLQPSPSPHPNLALYELLQWLAEECISVKDWGILKLLWHLCSGQAKFSSSCPVMVLTGGHTRLFQSHSANLYQEPKQLSIMVGQALLEAVHGMNRRCKKYDSLHKNKENKGKSEPIQEKCKIMEDSGENIPKNNESPWKFDQNHCTIHKIHETEQKKSKILKDSQIQQENTNNCTQMGIPDWLEEERLKLNNRGERIYTLTSEYSLWHHRQLATEAGVYVIACRVFQWLCDVFGVSTKLAYPLEWGEKGYCLLDRVR